MWCASYRRWRFPTDPDRPRETRATRVPSLSRGGSSFPSSLSSNRNYRSGDARGSRENDRARDNRSALPEEQGQAEGVKLQRETQVTAYPVSIAGRRLNRATRLHRVIIFIVAREAATRRTVFFHCTSSERCSGFDKYHLQPGPGKMNVIQTIQTLRTATLGHRYDCSNDWRPLAGENV